MSAFTSLFSLSLPLSSPIPKKIRRAGAKSERVEDGSQTLIQLHRISSTQTGENKGPTPQPFDPKNENHTFTSDTRHFQGDIFSVGVTDERTFWVKWRVDVYHYILPPFYLLLITGQKYSVAKTKKVRKG